MPKIVAKENTAHIYDLVATCVKYGIRKAVICPGSRCAPLIIGFGKHPDIETISITDERSAGFVGLGLAQQEGRAVALVCTSGTAAQNFIPAVTEAFYQNVPLLVLTADRPAQWIDQWDGQTIHQNNLYQNHIKASLVFDEKNLQVAEAALELVMTKAYGPVHLNIPIREPFYPENLTEIKFPVKSLKKKSNDNSKIITDFWQELQAELNHANNILILGGQYEPSPDLLESLRKINIPIVGDVISNQHSMKNIIKSAELVFNSEDENLKPDLLISFGRSVISKNLKLYLRKHKPKSHWHVGIGMVGDPFQSLTKTVQITPECFFKQWLEQKPVFSKQDKYQSALTKKQLVENANLKLKLDTKCYNSFTAVAKIIETLPPNSALHLGNSMPVRIANFIGINKINTTVWSNRGTSGIDGTVSTAVGHALAATDIIHTLIVGDLAFFYDRNGLWLNHQFPQNLRIVILNDGGGGIFDMIVEPSNLGALSTLFTTLHQRTAKLTAEEFALEYQSVRSNQELTETLVAFDGGILEIFTDMQTNTNFFKSIMNRD